MEKWMKWFLVGLIIFGVFLRFYQLDKAFLYGDEKTELIASLKLNHENWQAGVDYENPHPPLAKWLMGVATKNIERNFLSFVETPPNYAWEYIMYEIIGANYLSPRIVSAISGTLFVIFIFLITRRIFGNDAGIWGGGACGNFC